MTPIAIAGVGKIARDQHLPSIAASDRFRLAAAVSLHPVDLDVPVFASIGEMMAAVPEVAAVAICTPPAARSALLREAFAHGLHVLAEKPPAATLTEAEGYAALARTAGRTLFLAWHSRAAAGVEPARAWLATREVRRVRIDWLEDVRVWHPGQEWIWTPGIGVFDPGINALSILTRVLPAPVSLVRSRLVYPADRAAPVAATLDLATAAGAPVEAEFSFDQRGPQTWTIAVETDDGTAVLADGGSRLTLAGEPVELDDIGEYPRVYDRFADLIASGRSDADLAPFRLVADAFMAGTREVVAALRLTD